MSPCQSNSRSSTSRVADRLPLWGPIHLAWTVKEKKKTSCSRSTVAESRVQIDALYRSPIIIQQDEDCLATPNPLLASPHRTMPIHASMFPLTYPLFSACRSRQSSQENVLTTMHESSGTEKVNCAHGCTTKSKASHFVSRMNHHALSSHLRCPCPCVFTSHRTAL
jgi:hypothetical protein